MKIEASRMNDIALRDIEGLLETGKPGEWSLAAIRVLLAHIQWLNEEHEEMRADWESWQRK